MAASRAGITHARHRRMIEVMLGEMLEQARLFHQAAPAARISSAAARAATHARRRAAHALGGVVPLAGIALGSNLGDRRAHIDSAVASLGADARRPPCLPIFETEPIDAVGPQAPFLNAAAAAEVRGRGTRTAGSDARPSSASTAASAARGAARTLDLDLIFFGDGVWTSRGWPCRIRGSASGDSCSSRWPSWRRTGATR